VLVVLTLALPISSCVLAVIILVVHALMAKSSMRESTNVWTLTTVQSLIHVHYQWIEALVIIAFHDTSTTLPAGSVRGLNMEVASVMRTIISHFMIVKRSAAPALRLALLNSVQ
jgi:hypothetical protein